MTLVRPVEYIREDECPICHTERSLELYDKNNKPIRFSLALDMSQGNQLIQKELRYFRCTRCEHIFGIDFTGNEKIPKPLEDKKVGEFINRYKLLYYQS